MTGTLVLAQPTELGGAYAFEFAGPSVRLLSVAERSVTWVPITSTCRFGR